MFDDPMEREEQLEPAVRARVFRPRQDRRLAGVCAGLAPVTRIGIGWLRLAFVLGALVGGLGVVVYLACWLIIPEHDGIDSHAGPGGLVVLAWATGGVLILALLALLSAVATVFGLGWAVLTAAAAVLAAPLMPRPRLRPVWVLPAVAALTLPSVAVALSPVRLPLEPSPGVTAPASVRTLDHASFSSGLDRLFVDLRRTSFPATGTIPIRIEAGIKRTIVALPDDRCVHIVVHYAVHPFARQLASLLSGTPAAADYGVVLFGVWRGSFAPSGTSGTIAAPGGLAGPTLAITFVSQGGSLYVRDYPDAVAPQLQPNWPGFHVNVEPQPNLRGEPRGAWPQIMRSWRERRAAELASAGIVNPLIPGPCTLGGGDA